MSAVVRPYRGISAEDRRAERRARLTEACLDLVGETGVASISAEAVAGRAGLTKRYFYESFTDRDALLYEVMDDFFTSVRAEMLDALARSALPPEQRAQLIARVLIEFLERDPRRARLYVESAGEPTLQARREEAYGAFSLLLLDAFRPRAFEPGPSEPRAFRPEAPGSNAPDEGRRALAALITVAGTTQAAISWLQGGVALPRDSVVDEIARMVLAALDPRPTR